MSEAAGQAEIVIRPRGCRDSTLPRRVRPINLPVYGEKGDDGEGARTLRPSARLDTRVIYCGDYLDQLRKLRGADILTKIPNEIN
jgi:hypothetical protein